MMDPDILEFKINKVEKELDQLRRGDRYLKAPQVAELLQISLSTAYTIMQDPSFPGRKIPGVGVRVRESDLHRYIDNLKK